MFAPTFYSLFPIIHFSNSFLFNTCFYVLLKSCRVDFNVDLCTDLYQYDVAHIYVVFVNNITQDFVLSISVRRARVGLKVSMETDATVEILMIKIRSNETGTAQCYCNKCTLKTPLN